MTEYRYALVNRPLMLGTAPRGFLRVDPRPAPGEPFHDWARHGVLVYPRPLTDQETQQYELATLLPEEEEPALADRIAAPYREQAAALLAYAVEEPGWFANDIRAAIDRESTGYRLLVADPDRIGGLVLAALRSEVGL